MSIIEPACHSTPENAGLRLENLSFERIPQQSRLFLDYLKNPVALKRYYPTAVQFHHELAARVPEVLEAYRTDREALCEALAAKNKFWGAGAETQANIARLRQPGAVTVVTGQQAGLFTGSLYTIYKALSAVKLAACLTHRGTPAVPVFWMATEDHDWPEVQAAQFIACDGRLASVKVSTEAHREGLPVGQVVLDEQIHETIEGLLELLPTTEFTGDLATLLRDAYQPGRAYGEAFARMLTALTARHGLILLDPLDPRLKQLSAPLYSAAAERAPEIAAALSQRSRELEDDGYHAQVLTSAEAFPLFVHDEQTGARRALTRTADGSYQLKGTKISYSLAELSTWAARDPESFSPNVTLRSVVQDYLLPTVAYFGGAAEVAYFAQTAEVYRVLERPVTPIFHRASLTVVDPRTSRTLHRYQLHVSDFFNGLDALLARVVEQHLGAETARAFDRADLSITRTLDELQAHLRDFDPTLGDALTHGERKIMYQLKGLRLRFHRAQLARNRAAHRQLERASIVLYPEKSLQERHVNITSLLARHGRYITDWIYDAIDLSSMEHRIMYL